MKLIGFAFGIRFVKEFHIEDQLGAIVDHILYSNKSVFNVDLFPQISRNVGIYQLGDPIKGNKFTVNCSDLIFEYNVIDSTNFKNELNRFKDAYTTLVDEIFKTFGIGNIGRFGFIVKEELTNNDDLLNKVNTDIESCCDNKPDDSLALRFNIVKKKPVKIGNDVSEDFDNTIITYDRKNAKSPMYKSTDYQKYYNPELQKISDAPIKFNKFVEKCFDDYEKNSKK